MLSKRWEDGIEVPPAASCLPLSDLCRVATVTELVWRDLVAHTLIASVAGRLLCMFSLAGLLQPVGCTVQVCGLRANRSCVHGCCRGAAQPACAQEQAACESLQHRHVGDAAAEGVSLSGGPPSQPAAVCAGRVAGWRGLHIGKGVLAVWASCVYMAALAHLSCAAHCHSLT